MKPKHSAHEHSPLLYLNGANACPLTCSPAQGSRQPLEPAYNTYCTPSVVHVGLIWGMMSKSARHIYKACVCRPAWQCWAAPKPGSAAACWGAPASRRTGAAPGSAGPPPSRPHPRPRHCPPGKCASHPQLTTASLQQQRGYSLRSSWHPQVPPEAHGGPHAAPAEGACCATTGGRGCAAGSAAGWLACSRAASAVLGGAAPGARIILKQGSLDEKECAVPDLP